MNVFIIPSWYPSKDDPTAGIFNKEQAEALAYLNPDSNFAISSWGSHDEDLLLWGRDRFRNLSKIIKFSGKPSTKTKIAENLTEYFSPAFTWTRKILNGNISKIIAVNERHFLDFQSHAGRVDVIHAHSAHPGGWVAMKLSAKYKIPYVITEQMTPFPFVDFLTRAGGLKHWLKDPLWGSSCNIVVSPQQKETLQKWNVPHLKYIPNLTNEDFFKPALAKNGSKRPFVFFTLCNLVPQKGIPVLLNAVKRLVVDNRNVSFRIGGTGEDEMVYKKLAEDLNIAEYVCWLGPLNRHQALDEFQNCHAFVLPSIHENLPLVLLESIACGTPIISTRCGGPESIINGKNGILVEPGDSDALANAISSMIDNANSYSSNEIREDFCQRYSRHVVCRQIMEVYQQAVVTYQS